MTPTSLLMSRTRDCTVDDSDKKDTMSTVIAEIFVHDLISYIRTFNVWLKVRKPCTYTSVSENALAVRKFRAYKRSCTPENEIFTRTKISAISVLNSIGDQYTRQKRPL